MKKLFVLILISIGVCCSASAQDKPTEQHDIQAIQQANEAKLDQLESLQQLYQRLSAEVILDEALLDAIIGGGPATRASCTADCPDGTTVTCTGDPCVAIDGVGCNAATAGNGRDLKRCKNVDVIIAIE